MGNTQINPPIVPAPAPKRNALGDLAQYASEDEYEEQTRHSHSNKKRRILHPKMNSKQTTNLSHEESEYPFED